MNFSATRKSAVLTGTWTALGMVVTGKLLDHSSLHTQDQNLIFLVGAVVFFFVPVALFVVGPSYFRFGMRDIATKSYWVELGAVGLRLLCWFSGAAVCGFLLTGLARLAAI